MHAVAGGANVTSIAAGVQAAAGVLLWFLLWAEGGTLTANLIQRLPG